MGKFHNFRSETSEWNVLTFEFLQYRYCFCALSYQERQERHHEKKDVHTQSMYEEPYELMYEPLWYKHILILALYKGSIDRHARVEDERMRAAPFDSQVTHDFLYGIPHARSALLLVWLGDKSYSHTVFEPSYHCLRENSTNIRGMSD